MSYSSGVHDVRSPERRDAHCERGRSTNTVLYLDRLRQASSLPEGKPAAFMILFDVGNEIALMVVNTGLT